MLPNNSSSSVPSSEPFSCLENGNTNKRKRRPAGTPDPDAEVVSLSPKTLLESDRYVCEICNQGFQRDQNLQMHRRRHKVPWKLLKRETPVVKKRVFVCPEPSCLHHDPCHALGDLVGIKKHFRRKHSNHKQWVCDKCSKGYAVQSDYKAHLKTCGTRGHSCDCGRVFSRVESFIEHQDACNMDRVRSESQALQPAACLSRTASSPSPSCSDNNFSRAPPNWPPPSNLVLPHPNPTEYTKLILTSTSPPAHPDHLQPSLVSNKALYNLDLQLATTSNNIPINEVSSVSSKREENHSTQLQLSIGSSSSRLKEEAREQLRLALAEKAYAEEARRQAEHQIELAEKEFANAKRIRQQAQAELDKAQALKEQAIKKVNSTILQITCHACKQQFIQADHPTTRSRATPTPTHEAINHSLVLSYMSSAITSEGDPLDNNNIRPNHAKPAN
ncbi:protein SHOOT GRAVITROPISM 5-like [Prunus yedoensis var. nudiflora]|uniref:Protein SHOOT GRAVITROPISM 5-like n=1 Tax=Prunus yedoensis var. nudiflora TaxID=2094558 RepID=A0A314UQW3_PRUYE|nr:protein SHOOT GRAVITROPISM 5-like [Prunus yedoensis var. nudiflora]